METEEKPKRSKRKIIIFFLILIAVLILFYLGYFYLKFSKIFADSQGNLASQTVSLISGKKLSGQNTGDINVLFMGLRGQDQIDPDLTNGVMVLNYDIASKKANAISLSRDFYIPMTNGTYEKINSIYKAAKADPTRFKDPVEECQNAVSRALGISIDYTFMVDFDGFIKIVDSIGTIDVAIPQSANYPFLNTTEFKKVRDLANPNLYHLNGKLALTFVDWPYNALPDYDRLTRQQIFISTLETQILSKKNLLDPTVLNESASVSSKNVKTNFAYWELIKYLSIVSSLKSNDIQKFELTSEGANALVQPTNYDGFTLSPPNNDFSQIKVWASNIVNN